MREERGREGKERGGKEKEKKRENKETETKKELTGRGREKRKIMKDRHNIISSLINMSGEGHLFKTSINLCSCLKLWS